MVIPLGAPKVVDLVHHGLEPVVHVLCLFTFIEDEPTKFTLNCFLIGDFCDFVPSCVALRTSQIFLTLFNPCLLLYSSLLSHPVLEGKPNANHVRARISNSRTQQLHS
jgi:hypothetical protein